MISFKHGPYTAHADRRRIPAQEETERKNKRRIFIWFLLPVTLILGYFFGNERPIGWLDNQPPQESRISEIVPECTTEDGSDSQICYWADGSGDFVVNFGYGHYTYNTTRGTMQTYGDG